MSSQMFIAGESECWTEMCQGDIDQEIWKVKVGSFLNIHTGA